MTHNIKTMRNGAIISALLAGAAIGGILFVQNTSGAPEEHSTNKELEWIENFLKQHISCVVSGSTDAVTVISDGNILKSHQDYDQKTFSLARGDHFYNPPDHHASISYTIEAITDQGIKIEYESRFDHSSFGTELITVDRGTLVFPCD